MVRLRKSIAAAVVSASLIVSSTAAVASAPAPAPATDGWLTLSMLTPSGAAVLDSTAVAAQPATVTCPDGTVVANGAPCPGPTPYAGPGFPPIPVIIVWLAVLGVAIYILTKHHHRVHIPNSPA
jgi:ABC-type transport system substrate-binding protein